MWAQHSQPSLHRFVVRRYVVCGHNTVSNAVFVPAKANGLVEASQADVCVLHTVLRLPVLGSWLSMWRVVCVS